MTIPKINLEPDPSYKSKLHRKSMNGFITLMVITSIGMGGYATAQDELKQATPHISGTITAEAVSDKTSLVGNTDKPLDILANTENATVQTLKNWIKSQNPDLPAKEIAECSYRYTTERKINAYLPLAITEKESNTWSHYKIQQMDGKWVDYKRGNDNFDDIKQIGVKKYRDHKIYYNGGGIMGRSKDWSDQSYSSKNLEYTLNFRGSIAGYTSYCEYLDNLTWLLDVGYPSIHSDDLNKSELDQFAKTYVGTSSYKQYSQNISEIILKIKNN
jgi:hypothetical protein